MSVFIGMEQTPVLSELRAHFLLTPNDSDNEYFVWEGKGSSSTLVGSATFKQGRLTAASRQWGHFQDRANPVHVTKALLAALESAPAVTGKDAEIKSHVQRTPGAELTTLEFLFPGRKVSVLTTDGGSKYGQQVSISEFILESAK